jgi:DNA-binding NarL/FixJ family response regulator
MVGQAIGAFLTEEGFEVVQMVGDGASLVEAAKMRQTDVIVMDMSMPGLSGLDALRRLREAGVKTKVIFLTMHADPELACEAMRAGASGYVLKVSSGEELVAAIKQVLRGRVYLTPMIAKDVLAAMASPRSTGHVRPTNRQLQVLELLVAGNTMKEVASNLGLSPRTVETHKYEMMDTLGVRTTAELVGYALRHRLIGSP